MQWVIASMPVAAVRCGGRRRVSSGSQIADCGMSFGPANVALRPSFMMMMMPTDTSLPVPDVVGTAITGATFVMFLVPFCAGSNRSSGPPLPARRATALPRSMAEPPPSAITPSQFSAV